MTLPDGRLHPIERQLLDELGDLDPVSSQLETLRRWELLAELPAARLRARPADGEWSAMDVLAHLIAVELTNGLRYRAMLVEDSPALASYDVSEWSGLLRAPDAETAALLALFRALRESNLEFWAGLDDAARARTGIHPDCGLETIELRFHMLAGHDRMHLRQASRAAEAAAR